MTMKHRVRLLWHWLKTTVVTFCVGIVGVSCREKHPSPVQQPPQTGLLPNPAFVVQQRDGQTILVANAEQPNEAAYRLDDASLALWKTLLESSPKELPFPEGMAMGLTESAIIDKMQKTFPHQDREEIARQVKDFLAIAIAEGIVVPAKSTVRVVGTDEKNYFKYEPPLGIDRKQ